MTCWVTWRVEVEGKKTAIWDDGVLVGKGTRCSTLCSTQGAGAGLFDILILLSGKVVVDSTGYAAEFV